MGHSGPVLPPRHQLSLHFKFSLPQATAMLSTAATCTPCARPFMRPAQMRGARAVVARAKVRRVCNTASQPCPCSRLGPPRAPQEPADAVATSSCVCSWSRVLPKCGVPRERARSCAHSETDPARRRGHPLQRALTLRRGVLADGLQALLLCAADCGARNARHRTTASGAIIAAIVRCARPRDQR